MSDEFIKVATKEIGDDLFELENTLSICTSDSDVILNAEKFQKHTHKIKGLAPMMEKQDLGNITASLDTIFKIITSQSEINGVLQILNEIIPHLRDMLIEPNYDVVNLKEKISQLEDILN